MHRGKVVSDWTKNWQASLPVKVTAIVLWGLVIAGVVATAVLLDGVEERIDAAYRDDADRLARHVALRLRELPDLEPEQIIHAIESYDSRPRFAGVEIHVGADSLFLGEQSDKLTSYSHEMPVVLKDGNVAAARIEVYYPPFDELVGAKRKEVLVSLIGAVLLFGMLLTLILRKVLTKPFDYMVTTTRAIADGDLALRLDEDRPDEFGTLSKFFNQMLDRIEMQQRNLRESLARVRQSEAALLQEKERAQVTLHSIGDGVITTDVAGAVEYLNPIAEELTGWTSAQAKGLPLARIFSPIHELTRQPIEIRADSRLREYLVFPAQQTLLPGRDGGEHVIEGSAAPIRNRAGGVIGIVIAFRDVTNERAMVEQVSYQASHDILTGLPNRREFERRLQQMIESAKQRGELHALCYMDLDQFKVINDLCGHAAGDQLLCEMAELLKEQIGGSDTLARLGGDEFGVLLDRCDLERAKSIADKLHQAVKGYRFIFAGRSFTLSASIGVVGICSESEGHAQVLSAADAACFAAKDKGRNRVQIYHANDTELAQRQGEMEWAQRITHALEENRFSLFQQTVLPISPRAGRGRHFEVLLRMIGEQGEVVPPNAFIPAAERYNLMPLIDRWVLRAVLADEGVQAMARRGELETVAINLSGQSLCEDQFLDFVIDALGQSEALIEKICFEITETAAIANLGRATRFIAVLKGMGCRFSLDDFGSGLSSFRYLNTLQVDYLKIDGSFIKRMLDDPAASAIVEAINQVGHAMGIRTVAEFVENDALLSRLKVLGVDYAQGYGIAKPQPLLALQEPVRRSLP